MASADKVPMLQEGHAFWTSNSAAEKHREAPVVEAIEVARAHGDLSENAEYHAAKERQGQIEATIADLEDKLSRRDGHRSDDVVGRQVVFGATVTSSTRTRKRSATSSLARPRPTPRLAGSAIIRRSGVR